MNEIPEKVSEIEEKPSEEEQPAADPEVVDDEDLEPPLKKLLDEVNASIRNLEEQIRVRNWPRALIYVEDIEFRIKQMRGF